MNTPNWNGEFPGALFLYVALASVTALTGIEVGVVQATDVWVTLLPPLLALLYYNSGYARAYLNGYDLETRYSIVFDFEDQYSLFDRYHPDAPDVCDDCVDVVSEFDGVTVTKTEVKTRRLWSGRKQCVDIYTKSDRSCPRYRIKQALLKALASDTSVDSVFEVSIDSVNTPDKSLSEAFEDEINSNVYTSVAREMSDEQSKTMHIDRNDTAEAELENDLN